MTIKITHDNLGSTDDMCCRQSGRERCHEMELPQKASREGKKFHLEKVPLGALSQLQCIWGALQPRGVHREM